MHSRNSTLPRVNMTQISRIVSKGVEQLKEQASNVINRDTPLEKTIKEATANTNWGCATTLLAQLARATFDFHDYVLIMKAVWDCLADKPHKWRRIYKTLSLLEYLLKHGSDRVLDETREKQYRVRLLRNFHYIEEGQEISAGIQEKSTQICELINNDELLKEERDKARKNRDRFVGFGGHGERTGVGYNHAVGMGGIHNRSRPEEDSSSGRYKNYDPQLTTYSSGPTEPPTTSSRGGEEEENKNTKSSAAQHAPNKQKSQASSSKRNSVSATESNSSTSCVSASPSPKSKLDRKPPPTSLLDFDSSPALVTSNRAATSQQTDTMALDPFSNSDDWADFDRSSPSKNHVLHKPDFTTDSRSVTEEFGKFQSAPSNVVKTQDAYDLTFLTASSINSSQVAATHTHTPNIQSRDSFFQDPFFSSPPTVATPPMNGGLNTAPVLDNSAANLFEFKSPQVPAPTDSSHFLSDINSSLYNLSLGGNNKQSKQSKNEETISPSYQTGTAASLDFGQLLNPHNFNF